MMRKFDKYFCEKSAQGEGRKIMVQCWGRGEAKVGDTVA